MELLFTILFWILAVLAGLIALPFGIIVTLFLFALLIVSGIALLFISTAAVIVVGLYIADTFRSTFRSVARWFKRTAGCK